MTVHEPGAEQIASWTLLCKLLILLHVFSNMTINNTIAMSEPELLDCFDDSYTQGVAHCPKH